MFLRAIAELGALTNRDWAGASASCIEILLSARPACDEMQVDFLWINF